MKYAMWVGWETSELLTQHLLSSVPHTHRESNFISRTMNAANSNKELAEQVTVNLLPIIFRNPDNFAGGSAAIITFVLKFLLQWLILGTR